MKEISKIERWFRTPQSARVGPRIRLSTFDTREQKNLRLSTFDSTLQSCDYSVVCLQLCGRKREKISRFEVNSKNFLVALTRLPHVGVAQLPAKQDSVVYWSSSNFPTFGRHARINSCSIAISIASPWSCNCFDNSQLRITSRRTMLTLWVLKLRNCAVECANLIATIANSTRF